MQLIILLIIGVVLVLQYFAIKKGLLVPTVYSKNQRVKAAVIVAVPIMIFGIIESQSAMVILGMSLGYVCFRRQTWYKRKEKGS
ncbi:hypothetical protein [Pseudoalteromonas 'SMAR']|uniref:hypothetical protein n=1 Tax=Pseudoalteromonas 'SMAR' TaxID=3416908 RepID=UPI003AF2BE95